MSQDISEKGNDFPPPKKTPGTGQQLHCWKGIADCKDALTNLVVCFACAMDNREDEFQSTTDESRFGTRRGDGINHRTELDESARDSIDLVCNSTTLACTSFSVQVLDVLCNVSG